MIQLIQVAGGDVYAVNREESTITRYRRADWHVPYTQVDNGVPIQGYVVGRVGDPLAFRTHVGWRSAPNVLRTAWMEEGQDIEDTLYSMEWIAGFEAFFHRGVHANNPYSRGTLENNFWTKGYDNAQKM